MRYLNNNPNKAFDEFQSTLITLYDEHCPVWTQRKHNYEDKLRGLEIACKEINVLHK